MATKKPAIRLVAILLLFVAAWGKRNGEGEPFTLEGWLSEHEGALQKSREAFKGGRCTNPERNNSYFWLDPKVALERSIAYGVRRALNLSSSCVSLANRFALRLS